jgi:TRAP-type mannitol/chloroaromatic compound transport system permease small subunit
MESIIGHIDKFSRTVGQTFGWSVIILTAGTCFEVFMRYVLNDPTSWAFDMSYMLYGALFMMAGAYTLSRSGHVRGDFIYRKWKPINQAKVDLVLYVIFFFPGILAMVGSGLEYGITSVRQLELSTNSPAGVPVWPLKLIIIAAGITMLIQGAGEVMRCLLCIRTGNWLPRDGDVEELEVMLQKEHGGVHE